MIETAMVGRDGVGNGTSALDAKVSLHKGIVQVAGTASVILPDVLRKLADEFEPLRGMLIRHEQVLFAQAQQSASLRTPVDGLGHQVRINAPFFVVTATCPSPARRVAGRPCAWRFQHGGPFGRPWAIGTPVARP